MGRDEPVSPASARNETRRQGNKDSPNLTPSSRSTRGRSQCLRDARKARGAALRDAWDRRFPGQDGGFAETPKYRRSGPHEPAGLGEPKARLQLEPPPSSWETAAATGRERGTHAVLLRRAPFNQGPLLRSAEAKLRPLPSERRDPQCNSVLLHTQNEPGISHVLCPLLNGAK